MNPSIIDVARVAGVSKSTVSRVLTGGSVSEKARKAVCQAMEELNYTPNQIAQVLRGKSAKVIGVVFPPEPGSLLQPSLSARLAGIFDTLFHFGYSVMVVNISSPEALEAFRMMENRQVDGLIFASNPDNIVWQEQMLSHRASVYIGERFDANRGFRVYMGNYNYSRDLYHYLLSNGHRKTLTVFQSGYNTQIVRRRKQACQDSYESFHADFRDASFLMFDHRAADVLGQLEQIYTHVVKESITALYVDSIAFAHELVQYLEQEGLALWKDYSVVSLERDSAPGPQTTNITSVHLSAYQSGVECAKLVMELLENEDMVYKDIRIPYTLEIRSSVRNISET